MLTKFSTRTACAGARARAARAHRRGTATSTVVLNLELSTTAVDLVSRYELVLNLVLLYYFLAGTTAVSF
eukprot:SAG31_NODE_10874_length_1088_cov_1.830131_2_plen_70_part_00